MGCRSVRAKPPSPLLQLTELLAFFILDLHRWWECTFLMISNSWILYPRAPAPKTNPDLCKVYTNTNTNK